MQSAPGVAVIWLWVAAQGSTYDCSMSRGSNRRVTLRVQDESVSQAYAAGSNPLTSLRLRGPDGQLVPLKSARVRKNRVLTPRSPPSAGVYTIERRADARGEAYHRGWFPTDHIEVVDLPPLQPPTDVRMRRSLLQLEVRARVQEGAYLGLEVQGVGLLAPGGDSLGVPLARKGEQVFLYGDHPCFGYRLPYRGAIVARAVSLRGLEEVAASPDARRLKPSKVKWWWPWIMRWKRSPTLEFREVPVDETPNHPPLSTCGSLHVQSSESLPVVGRVQRSGLHWVVQLSDGFLLDGVRVALQDIEAMHGGWTDESGMHAVLTANGETMHWHDGGVDVLDVPGEVRGVDDGQLVWTDQHMVWRASISDLSDATPLRASGFRAPPYQIDGHELESLAEVRQMHGDALHEGVLYAAGRRDDQWVFFRIQLDGQISEHPLPDAAAWYVRVRADGVFVESRRQKKNGGVVPDGRVFAWNGQALEASQLPERDPRSVGHTERTLASKDGSWVFSKGTAAWRDAEGSTPGVRVGHTWVDDGVLHDLRVGQDRSSVRTWACSGKSWGLPGPTP